MVDAPTLLPEGRPDDRTGLGYAMVAVAATLFALNGSVSKVVLDSGLSSLELAQIRATLAPRRPSRAPLSRRVRDRRCRARPVALLRRDPQPAGRGRSADRVHG